MNNKKTCKRCGQPNKEHYIGVTTKDGMRNPCKSCILELDRPKRHLRGLMKVGKPYTELKKEYGYE